MTEISTAFVVVPKEHFDTLTSKVTQMEKRLEEMATDTTFRMRVYAMAKKGVLKSSDVGQLMDWSQATMSRRIASGILPMTLDGNRYVIAVDEFLNWYKNYLMTKV